MIAVLESRDALTDALMWAGNELQGFDDLHEPIPLEGDWREWLTTLFPEYVGEDPDGFGEHHAEYWDWLWAVQADERPRPFVALWSRGGAKSTSAELGCVALGAMRKRRYVLYVSGTQEQADGHVASIASMLESRRVETYYPDLANRRVGKFGAVKGWRRNRLWTRSGFIIDAIGLDTAARGIKLEDARPDLIVLDDIDKESDSADLIQKKIRRITYSLLPAGAKHAATIAIQNVILEDGVFGRMMPTAVEPADYLADRIVSGPVPAIYDLATHEEHGRVTITGGTPSWPQGQGIAACQEMIDTFGITAFLSECQHQPRARGTKIYRREWWDNRNRFTLTDDTLARRAVARFMSWDTAESTSEAAAYSAVVVGDLIPYRDNHALLIRLVWRARLDFPDLLDAIRVIGEKWGFDNPPRNIQRDLIYIEYASSGRQAVQTIRRTSPHQWLKEKVIEHRVTLGKDDRGHLAAAYCRAGRVWLPDSTMDAPWLGVFQDELFSVPNAPHRDVTDAFSQLVINVRDYLTEPVQMRQEAA